MVVSKFFYRVFSLVILTWASPHSDFYNLVKLDLKDFTVKKLLIPRWPLDGAGRASGRVETARRIRKSDSRTAEGDAAAHSSPGRVSRRIIGGDGRRCTGGLWGSTTAWRLRNGDVWRGMACFQPEGGNNINF